MAALPRGMRSFVLALALLAGPRAHAKEATTVATDANEDIRAVGRVNVNAATRAELLRVPGLDAVHADALLAARAVAPIADLSAFSLPDDALSHLKTYGDSNFYRVRLHPLARFDEPARATR